MAQRVFGCLYPWSGEGSCHLLDEAGQVDVSLRQTPAVMSAQGDVNLRQTDRQTDRLSVSDRNSRAAFPSAASDEAGASNLVAKFPGVAEALWHFAWFFSFLQLILATSCHCHPCLGHSSHLCSFSTHSFPRSFSCGCYLIQILKSNPGISLWQLLLSLMGEKGGGEDL